MISLNFIFPNSENRVQKNYKGSQKVIDIQVYQVKENLICAGLPGQTDKNSIDYLRFFTMGKEMEDNKTLSSYPLHDPTHPLPIHVHVVYSQTPKLNSNCCGFCVVT